MKRPRIPVVRILRTVLMSAAVVSFPTPSSSQADGYASQAEALERRPPELEIALGELARLEADVVRGRLPSLDASIDPLLRFRDYPSDGAPGEWSGRLGVSATLGFGESPDTLARLMQRLERARRRAFEAELDSITSSLLVHVDLLEAQLEATEAAGEVEEARADLVQAAAARVSSDDGAEVQEAALELRAARLEQRKALLDLHEAHYRAQRHGLEGEAVYESVRFVLPQEPVDPRSTHEYLMLELELLEAEAELAEARRGPLDDLRLGAGYRARSIQLELEGGLMNGRPGARAGLDTPGGVERWEVEVSAQFVLTDDSHEIERLEEALALARAALDEFAPRFERELDLAFARARLAEEALELAERELELGGEPQRDDLYRAWRAYVRAVAGVLELSGVGWTVRRE